MPFAELRKAAGLSQEQLAIKVGVSRYSIIEYEKGRTSPTLQIANKIAHVLGCTSIDELLNPSPLPPLSKKAAGASGARKKAAKTGKTT